MNTSTLSTLLKIAAILHIGLICAGASMPKAVNFRTNIAAAASVSSTVVYRLFLLHRPGPDRIRNADIRLCARNGGRRASCARIVSADDSVLEPSAYRRNVCLRSEALSHKLVLSPRPRSNQPGIRLFGHHLRSGTMERRRELNECRATIRFAPNRCSNAILCCDFESVRCVTP